MTERRIDDSFLDELERAAKGLSVVTDRASSEELRRLFGELHEDEHFGDDHRAGENAVEFETEFEIVRSVDAPTQAG